MTNASQADAELILHLYELRTEPVMRKARNHIGIEFWPQSAEELQKVINGVGSEPNAYLRQVLSYWTMATTFVQHGALHEDLFADNAGELFFLYAKFRPFIPKVRETNPEFLLKIEEFVNRSRENQDRAEKSAQMIARLMAARAEKGL